MYTSNEQEQNNLLSTTKEQPNIMTFPEELEFPDAETQLAHVKIVETSGKISSD